MIVICLEGVHGSGKTELCNQFAKAGFEVLDEAFMDMPEVSLPPQSLTMEASWVSFWFQRLLKRQAELEREARENELGAVRETIFIADRSPYSAVFYAGEQGMLLEPLIRAQIGELERMADIKVVCVNVKVDESVLWDRIQQRLEREPWRRKYKEDNYDWMMTTLRYHFLFIRFYNSCQWDYTFDNSQNTISDLMHSVIAELAAAVPRFTETCPDDIRSGIKENMVPQVLLIPAEEESLVSKKRVTALSAEAQAMMESLSIS